MSIKYAERTLVRVGKLDNEIATLKDRLDAKLNDRRLLLAGLIADGEVLRTAVSNEVRLLMHATSIATTGRSLTDDQVREIRRLSASGVGQSELGRRYGISQPTVHRIVKRLSYQDVA